MIIGFRFGFDLVIICLGRYRAEFCCRVITNFCFVGVGVECAGVVSFRSFFV